MYKYFFFLILTTAAFAQQQDGTLELPEFVITGKEHIDVPQAQRLAPRAMRSIDSASLERFRVIDRELTELLPRMPRPSPIPTDKIFRGNAFLSAGKYSLPMMGLEFGSNVDVFDAQARGAFVNDNVNSRAYGFASATVGISIPENIFFVGRGRLSMRVEGDGRSDYLSYLHSTATPDREMSSFSLVPAFDGLYNGVEYGASMRMGNHKLYFPIFSQVDFIFSKVEESQFRIEGQVRKTFGRAEVSLSFVDDNRSTTKLFFPAIPDYQLFRFGARSRFTLTDKVRAEVKLVFSDAATATLERKQYIVPEVGAEYVLDSVSSVFARIGQTVEPVFTQDRLQAERMVPVMNLQADVSIVKLVATFGTALTLFDDLRLVASATYRSYVRKMIWDTDTTAPGPLTAELVPKENIHSVNLSLYGSYSVRLADRISLAVDVTRTENEPYSSPLRATLSYYHTFSFPLTLSASLDSRSATMLTSARMLLGAEVEYQIDKHLATFLRAANITGAEYEEWFGYNEPLMNVIIGVRARW